MRRESIEVKKKYADFVNSREFTAFYNQVNPSPTWRLILAAITFMIIFLAPITIYQLIRYLIESRRRKKNKKAFIEAVDRMIPTFVLPVMVNHALLTRPGSVAPGLFVGSFDPDAQESFELLGTTTDAIDEIACREPKNADERKVVELLSDMEFQPSRRRLLPMSITNGKPVYAFDLQVPMDALPNGELPPFLLCMAEPGPTGQIAVVPWTIAADAIAAASQ